jgi:hypothetical protein
MVVALLALAVAMIVGGLLAVVQGYDIVLLERGWTLVISGSVCATGGALLLGLSTMLSRLGKIQAELVKTRERMSQSEPVLPPSPALDPLAAVSSGLLAGGAGEVRPQHSYPSEAAEPTLPPFMRRNHEDEDENNEDEKEKDLSADVVPTRDADEAPTPSLPEAPARNDNRGPRLNLPRYLFGGRTPAAEEPKARDADVARLDPADDLDDLDFDFGRTERASDASESERAKGGLSPAVQDEPPAHERPPSSPPAVAPVRSDSERDREPEPGDTENAPSMADGPRTVVGTYNSGENRYVMFSDGSIEAETPDGMFRFDSLEELKEFIASGGERRDGSGPSPSK